MAISRNAHGKPSAKLPGTFKTFIARFRELGDTHERIAQAVNAARPLNRKTGGLIKIGIGLEAELESALRSHLRRARQHGATIEEVEQAILPGMNTCGFPRAVACWSWAWEQIERDRKER